MANPQPLNATFFGFRKREESGVLTRLAIAFAVLAVVLVGGFVALFWGAIGPFIGWYAEIISMAASGDTASASAMTPPEGVLGLVGGLMLWLFPLYILVASFEAGALRWLVRGERAGGLMGLAFGVDTWRVWFVYWMWFLLNMAFSIVMAILTAVLVGVLAVSTGGNPAAVVSTQFVVMAVQYVLMAYFAVRFAPAAATTIARGRFAFFDAWTVTKGRFWALFGAFLLLYLIYMLISLVLGGAVWAYVFMNSPVDPSAFANAPLEAIKPIAQAFLRTLVQPQSWIVLGALYLVSTLVALVFYIATYGVNARAALAALEEGKIKPAA